jgi:Trypsin-like peptidase domain
MVIKPMSCALFAFAALLSEAGFAEQTTSKVTDFGRVFTPSPKITLSSGSPAKLVRHNFTGMEAKYYRLRMKVSNPEHKPWTLAFKTVNEQLLSAFDSNQTDCESAEGCWTRRLRGEAISVEFAAPASQATAEVAGVLFMPAKVENSFYSPIQGKEIKKLSEIGSPSDEAARKIRRSAERLGMLVTSAAIGSSRNSWCCSGVKLTKDLFLTNWHCGAPNGANDDAHWKGGSMSEACQNAVVDMSWDEDDTSREFSCSDVLYASKTYDAAVMRLGIIADGEALTEPFSALEFSQATPAPGTELRIVQHDACQPKSVARFCTIQKTGLPSWWSETGQNVKPSEFSYNCPTEGGSSGSPVYQASDGVLLGLHHLGYDAGDEAVVKENTGVEIRAILDDIKAQGKLELYDEITKRQ